MILTNRALWTSIAGGRKGRPTTTAIGLDPEGANRYRPRRRRSPCSSVGVGWVGLAAVILLGLISGDGFGLEPEPVRAVAVGVHLNEGVSLEASTVDASGATVDRSPSPSDLFNPESESLVVPYREPERISGISGPVAGTTRGMHDARATPRRVQDSAVADALPARLNAPSLWSGLLPLGVVLTVIALIYWGLKRRLGGRPAKEVGFLQVVGRLNLTPRHQVILVRIGRRLTLIGVSGDRMSALGEIGEPVEAAELLTLASARTADLEGFDRLLQDQSRPYEDPEPWKSPGELRFGGGSGRGATDSVGSLLRRVQAMRRSTAPSSEQGCS